MTTYSTANLNIGDATRSFYFRRETSDERVIQMIFQERQYDLTRLMRFQDLIAFVRIHEALGLRPLIVDAGANIGASAIYFLGNFPKGLVVAIEPDTSNFELLARNVEGLAIEPMHAAIASCPGRARVSDAGIGHWGYRTSVVAGDDGSDGTVGCLSIDDIYASHAASCFPFLVKIDIEGAEGELFSGNTDWVARTPIIIIELHDWLLPKAGTSASFLRCISKLRRDFVYGGEDIYSIANDLDDLSICR